MTSLLLALVVAGLLPLLSSGQTSWEHARRGTGMVQHTRLALDRLVREMRAAQSFEVISPTLIRFTQYSGQATLTPPWWNTSYWCRRQITLSTGTVSAPSGYSIRLTVSHSSYVNAGKSLSNGNDLRVVYWNGSSWVELDRYLDDTSSWDSSSTRIWFQTQAAIAANSSNTNYYLYYCNSTAGTPPANPMNIFLFHDAFNGSSLNTTRWTTTLGSPSVSSGILTLPSNSRIFANAAYAFGTDTRMDAEVRLSTSLAANFYYWGAGDQDAYPSGGRWVLLWSDATYHYTETKNTSALNATYSPPSSVTSYRTYAITREGTGRVRHFQGTTQVGTFTSQIPTVNLRVNVWNNTSSNTINIDWAFVRRYVVPEPSASLGSEESNSPTVTIEYQLNAATNELEYRWVPTAFQPFAGPFRSMSVTCFDASGPAISCSNAASVRSVQISLVAMDPSRIVTDITMTSRAFRHVP